MSETTNCKKQISTYFRSKDFTEYLAAYLTSNNFTSSEFRPTLTFEGGSNENAGTWIHEDFVIIVARWLSPRFAVACDAAIKQLLVDGFVIRNNITEKQLKKLQKRLTGVENKLKLSEAAVRKQNYELQLHRIMAQAYTTVRRPNLTSEYPYDGRYFDFFEERSDCLIITELKAEHMTEQDILDELVNQKDYYKKAIQIAKSEAEGRNRGVRIKFLAPSFDSNVYASADLQMMADDETNIEFQFITLSTELLYLRKRRKQQTGDAVGSDRIFDKIVADISDIIAQRNT